LCVEAFACKRVFRSGIARKRDEGEDGDDEEEDEDEDEVEASLCKSFSV